METGKFRAGIVPGGIGEGQFKKMRLYCNFFAVVICSQARCDSSVGAALHRERGAKRPRHYLALRGKSMLTRNPPNGL